MKKLISAVLVTALLLVLAVFPVSAAQGKTHVVQKGDSMWKIAVKYQMGVSEIIQANPQVSDPNLIYRKRPESTYRKLGT